MTSIASLLAANFLAYCKHNSNSRKTQRRNPRVNGGSSNSISVSHYVIVMQDKNLHEQPPYIGQYISFYATLFSWVPEI